MNLDLFGVRKLTDRVEKLSTEIDLQLKSSFDKQLATSFTNFSTQIFPHYNVIKEELIFQTMDDIYSVVSRLAADAADIPFQAEKEDGTELPPKDKLHEFVKTLTFEELEKFYTCLYLMGEVFAYKEVIDFGVNAGLERLEFLNPQKMVVVISRSFPTKIVGFVYYDSFNGYSKYFDVDEIFFVRTFNPTSDIQKQFRGLGLGTILKTRLTRVQAALDVSVAQLQNGGIPGVMYEKAQLEAGALGKRQDNFAKFLSNSNNKGAPYMLNGDVGYFSIGSDLADLNVAELASIDFDKICNCLSVSSLLFNTHKASTYNNIEQVIKAKYTSAVLPQVKRMRDAFNKQCTPSVRTTGTIKYSTKHIKELQDNAKTIAEAFAASPVMCPNDVLEGLGQKRTGDPLMDKFYIKSGYTPIEDMETVDIIPNEDDDFAQPVKEPKK